MIITAVAFVYTAVIHFSSLFNLYQFPPLVIMPINIVAALVFYAAYVNWRKAGNQIDPQNFKKAIFDLCPKWLAITNGIHIHKPILRHQNKPIPPQTKKNRPCFAQFTTLKPYDSLFSPLRTRPITFKSQSPSVFKNPDKARTYDNCTIKN
jgi:hypothetical protein